MQPDIGGAVWYAAAAHHHVEVALRVGVVAAVPLVAARAEGLVVLLRELFERLGPALCDEVGLVEGARQDERLGVQEVPDVAEAHALAHALHEGELRAALGREVGSERAHLRREQALQDLRQLLAVAPDRRRRAIQIRQAVVEPAAREGTREHRRVPLRHVPRAVDPVERLDARRLAERLRDEERPPVAEADQHEHRLLHPAPTPLVPRLVVALVARVNMYRTGGRADEEVLRVLHVIGDGADRSLLLAHHKESLLLTRAINRLWDLPGARTTGNCLRILDGQEYGWAG